MLRLFAAVDLPESAIAELVRIRPVQVPDVRLVDPAQIHLTLHFLGEADPKQMAAALQKVEVPAFSITFQGVGHFTSADRSVILWAGVRESPELLNLHSTVASALATQGFRPESRPFSPHITLAWCKPGSMTDTLGPYLAKHATFLRPDVPITRFGLYSSVLVGNGPVYRCENSFPLLTDQSAS